MNARLVVVLVAMVAASWIPSVWPATPPDVVNYQGVLRDAAGLPQDGTFDMVFRFFSSATGGDEILVDAHTDATGNAVTVTGGMFGVRLGTGAVDDGTGPGSYGDLMAVFENYGNPYLQIEVAGEVLAPRVPVASTPFALNASSLGGRSADEFLDTSGATQTKNGGLVVDASGASSGFGLSAYGPSGGAYFQNSTSLSYAQLAAGVRGIEAHGASTGGFFMNDGDLSHAYAAQGGYGLKGFGPTGGGYFADDDSTGWVAAAYGDRGVWAAGNEAGGLFQDLDNGSYAWVGHGNNGIEAYGQTGGYFYSTAGGASAWIAGGSWGVTGSGSAGGASFSETDSTAQSKLAFGNVGVDANGGWAGAILRDSDGTSMAWLAYGNEGVRGAGNSWGGYFYDNNGSGEAYLGYGDYGIQGYGSGAGGYFSEDDTSAYAFVANLGWGIKASGPGGGGEFNDTDASGFARVGYGAYKIQGTGAVSFVQNHPERSDEVIVYHSPEGDEVATYTRGSARLVDGEARIRLGETFAWVTNPDIGLTAHLTPHGAAVPLAVVSLTTEELVVRGPTDGPAELAFDYMVYGLRIGFESMSVVQEKQREAWIPSMEAHLTRYARDPGLRRYNALERFKTMTADVRGVDEADLDFGRAHALRAAIQEYDRDVHGPIDAPQLGEGRVSARGRPERDEAAEVAPASTAPTVESSPTTEEIGTPRGREARREGEAEIDPERPNMIVAVPVEIGDVLSFDRESLDRLTPSSRAYDGAVVGIAAGASSASQDGSALSVPVAFSGVVPCKVDASYGAIVPGDLLTTSPTSGHAMIAIDPAPGTVIGKAIESADSGTSTIRVLVMAR